MCFFGCLTGCSANGTPTQNSKIKISQRKSLIEKYYKVVPIHKRQDLLDETIKLINSYWPKTRAERLSILGCSKDDLPISLILTFKKRKNEVVKDNAIISDMFFDQRNQNAPIICSESGKPINVFAHLRLVGVPANNKACFVESMIIHHDFRGKGLGSYFIKETEKFCEEKLHLKSIFLSTYDSGEFYMKIGFHLVKAICVYGNGEVNNVSKKIYLKKDLNYVEPEENENSEDQEEIYDPTKDYNYNQQKQMENDIIVSGLPFKIDRPKSFVDTLCVILDYPAENFKYYYSYEILKRETEIRKFYIMISCVSLEAKEKLMEKFKNFGVMCFQDFFEKPINEWDNTLISYSQRYTNLNFIILKELEKLKEDRWISDYTYNNYQFHAKQNDSWIIVRNLEVIEDLKTPDLPDVSDEEIEVWSDDEEHEDPLDRIAALKHNFKEKKDENWLNALRRPSEIKLEPLFIKRVESTSCLSHHHHSESLPLENKLIIENSWVHALRTSNDAITLGLNINDY